MDDWKEQIIASADLYKKRCAEAEQLLRNLLSELNESPYKLKVSIQRETYHPAEWIVGIEGKEVKVDLATIQRFRSKPDGAGGLMFDETISVEHGIKRFLVSAFQF